MAEIITMMSGKGGAGKTSIAVNLAHFFSKYGLKTLLVDCDLNTNGATAFFSLKGHLPNTLNDHLVFSQILQEMADTSMGVSAEYINKECIHLENGVDFIPATDLQRKFNGQYSRETLENIKNEFYQLIGSWEEQYNIILFDQSAGYTDLIDLMMPLSTRVLLVREWNMLSLDTTRSLYRHISSLYSNMEIMCCINKIPGREYKNITNTTWNDIIPQISGFELNQQLADQLEQGKLIDIGDNEFSAILNKIAMFIAPVYRQTLMEYEHEIAALREEKRRKREEEYQKEQTRLDEKWSKIIPGYVGATLALSIAIGLTIYFLMDKTAPFGWIGFIGALVLLIFIGLYWMDSLGQSGRVLRLIKSFIKA